jgi:CDP-diacylglycerol--serine O-phosphatidyltransferase
VSGRAVEHELEHEPSADERERRGLRKGLYVIPSAFTAANIGMGFYAVMGALRGFQLVEGGTEPELERAAQLFDKSAQAIGWAVVFDALDGRIARMTKTTTEIGIQLDSLADVLTFGIAPAVLAYAWGYGAAFADGSKAHTLGWFLSFMFLICGAFRLARFNVQATRPRVLAEGVAKVDKKNFVGLPIPMAGGFIAALVHFAPLPLSDYGPDLSRLYGGLLMGAVALLSALMVSTVRYSSFKTLGARQRSTHLVILGVIATGMLIWLFSRYVLIALISVYILHGLLMRLYGVIRHRLSRARPA